MKNQIAAHTLMLLSSSDRYYTRDFLITFQKEKISQDLIMYRLVLRALIVSVVRWC